MINNSRTREQPLTISATVVKELQDRQKFAQNFGQKVNQNIAQNFGQSLQYLYAFFSQVVADDIHTGLVGYSLFVWAATGSGRLGRNRQVGEQLVNPACNLFKNCSYYPMNKRVGHSCNSGASAAANQLLLYSSLPGSSSRSAFSVHAGYG